MPLKAAFLGYAVVLSSPVGLSSSKRILIAGVSISSFCPFRIAQKNAEIAIIAINILIPIKRKMMSINFEY